MPVQKQKKSARPIRIAWAVALEGWDKKALQRTIASLQTGACSVRIEPVHIVQDKGLNVPKKSLDKYFKPYAEAKLRKLVTKTGIPELLPPKAVTAVPNDQRGAALALDEYARRSKADWLLVQSHGRVGITRAVLGSFAESLILQSQTPVLVTGPLFQNKVSAHPDVLFPTDFGPQADLMFQSALELAKRLNLPVTVLHVSVARIEYVLDPNILQNKNNAAVFQSLADELWRTYEAKAEAWKRKAEQAGVPFQIVFEAQAPSVAEGILKHIQRRPPVLVTMVSQSEHRFPRLLGSASREVARRSNRPVLIWRVKGKKGKARKTI